MFCSNEGFFLAFQNLLVASSATVFSPHFHIRRGTPFYPQAQPWRLGRKRDLLLKMQRKENTADDTPLLQSALENTLPQSRDGLPYTAAIVRCLSSSEWEHILLYGTFNLTS